MTIPEYGQRPEHSPVIMWLMLALLALLAAGGLVAGCVGCDPEVPLNCATVCRAGTECNEVIGECEEVALRPFEAPVPGRAVRMGPEGERVALAVLEPEQGYLLVGTATREGHKFHVLHRLERPAGKRVALATSTRHVMVAWLDVSGVYQVATRAVGADNDQWRTHAAGESALGGPLGYEGSEEFTLVIDDEERIHLLFYDSRQRALVRLSAPRADGPWQLDLVDDGTIALAGGACSAEQRESSRRGVGLEPSVLAAHGALYVAYHDADCGDLRLARYSDGHWLLSVVDTGITDQEGGLLERGVTGRFPSVAMDGAGRLALAYYDVSRARLMFATARDGHFYHEVADSGMELDEFSQERKHLVGAFASLVFDNNGRPRIAYMNSTRTHLRLAQRMDEIEAEGRWVQRSVSSEGPVGFFTRQLFDARLGHVVATERLVPTPEGLESRLVLVWDGAP